jgi:hypothetical protein
MRSIFTLAAIAAVPSVAHADSPIVAPAAARPTPFDVCMQLRREIHDRASKIADLDERMRVQQGMPKCHPDAPVKIDEPIEADATHSPGFVTIDRFDAVSRVGAELSYLFVKGTSLTYSRIEPHVQYVDRTTGMGAYASVPITYGTNASGLGDLELGGLSAPPLHPNIGVVFRAGITVPSGSTSDASASTNLIGALSRIGDSSLAIPKGTSLRLGVSPLVRWGPVFARADVGFDANLSSEVPSDNVIRINAGLGCDFEQVAVMGELADVHAFGHAGWIQTAAVSLRAKLGVFQPYASLVFPVPLDSSGVIDGALTVGLEIALR